MSDSILIYEQLKANDAAVKELTSAFGTFVIAVSNNTTALQALTQKVGTLLTKADDLNGMVADLQTALTQNTNTTQSVVSLMTTQHQELMDALANPDPTQAVADARAVVQAFQANTQALADAVAANPDPNAPPTPTPPTTNPTETTPTETTPPDVLTPTADNPSGVQPA